jgi:hypothetical protein
LPALEILASVNFGLPFLVLVLTRFIIFFCNGLRKFRSIWIILIECFRDKYGQDIKEAVAAAASNSSSDNGAPADPSEELKARYAYKDDRGFIVLDSEVEDYLTCKFAFPYLGVHIRFSGGKPKSQPFGPSNHINREWEIVTVRELCRRLSLEDSFEAGEMPLPAGSTESKVLDEFMINQIVDILPPRAEGYPWVMIYSSEKHGFSLSTMYR